MEPLEIFRSKGLPAHMVKRKHYKCLKYIDYIPDIIANPDYIEQKALARTRDISGGGVRFTATESLEVGSKLLIVLHLTNDKLDHMFYLVTDIISCVPIENVQDRWEVRGRWEFKNIKDRDLIVRWVFEEDRMIRKKENG